MFPTTTPAVKLQIYLKTSDFNLLSELAQENRQTPSELASKILESELLCCRQQINHADAMAEVSDASAMHIENEVDYLLSVQC